MKNRSNGSSKPEQTVLVFQGGGALGAFQAGVYEALHEADIEPDWIIGTSIGAINASLIAGNERQNRVSKLKEFWHRMADRYVWDIGLLPQHVNQSLTYWKTLCSGIPGFFNPNPSAFIGPHVKLSTDNAGFYSTVPLEETLGELVDFSVLNRCSPRLTVGAARVRTSEMKYFDSRDMELNVKHILASGALPPAFPAVRLDGELYWDGGILSNTPTEVVFDDNPRKSSIIFAVHLWNPVGEEPETIWQVLHRHKDIQYSSRVASHIARQAQIHKLRHVINALAGYLPDQARKNEKVQELLGYGCLTTMHVVRLLVPSVDHEDHTKDVDFSPAGIKTRWRAGLEHARRAIESEPWNTRSDPLEGVVLHNPSLPPSPILASESSSTAVVH